MSPTLGYCEDSECATSALRESVRLFRCAIHCDRNLCLRHLNAHDFYYEEEKKQNDIVIGELQKSLSLYQTMFDQQLVAYRELVRQASTVLLKNTSALMPIDEVQLITEKLREAISAFRGEKSIIKCESIIDVSDVENNTSRASKENINIGASQTVTVRLPRIECEPHAARILNVNLESNNENMNTLNDRRNQDDDECDDIWQKATEKNKRKSSSLKRLHK